jgi:hypothetical protein
MSSALLSAKNPRSEALMIRLPGFPGNLISKNRLLNLFYWDLTNHFYSNPLLEGDSSWLLSN